MMRLRYPIWASHDQAVIGQMNGHPYIMRWDSTFVCPKRWLSPRNHDKVVHSKYKSGDELNQFK